MGAKKDPNRIGITLSDEENERFLALSDLEGEKAATLAGRIIKEYMQEHASEIDSILAAKKNYEREIEKFRSRKAAQ